jgi:uncharacterized surface protein with fasciclin (FAS1) repeats
MLEHYEVPEWLKGSTWEVLETDGNYSIFLEGAELAGFKPILQGKNILTVMAPDDTAFSKYLQDNNYSGISDLNSEELKKLIGFHLLYYSYNKERMINFRPEGDLATEEDKLKNAGLYYKFRTRSVNKSTNEIEPATGKHLTVYHLESFLPVFSYRYFNTKGIDAKTNYEYFYPGSSWEGENGFNVSNASVKEYQIIADNGYIYVIDKVLEPLETIYNELEKNNNYSMFFDLYNRNSYYEYDATLTTDYASSLGADSLYLHKHSNLPSIAVEWANSNYTDVATNARYGNSIFAPDNEALSRFFKEFWETGGYESIEEVDDLTISYLIHQFIYSGDIVFPGEIEKGTVKNEYGMPFNFNPSTINDKVMCVNGTFYGIDNNNFLMPPLFGSVVGPAFRDKDLSYYLYMLSGSGLLTSYASQDAKYTLLIPSNEQFIANGIELKTYTTGSSLQRFTEDGWADISSGEMQSIVNLHTAIGEKDLNSVGTQIIATQTGFNYWFIKDGKISSSARFNRLLEPTNIDDPFVPLTEITNNSQNWNNGIVYKYDHNDIFTSEKSDGLQHALAVSNDQRYEYYSFAQLLKLAGMINPSTNKIRDFIMVNRFISFIPTNKAVRDAILLNGIPGIKDGTFSAEGTLTVSAGNLDAARLRSYLLNYFITDIDNVITTYPYPGSTMRSNTYISAGKQSLKYTDSGTSLSIQLGTGNTVDVINDYNYFPFAFKDGSIQFIDEIL